MQQAFSQTVNPLLDNLSAIAQGVRVYVGIKSVINVSNHPGSGGYGPGIFREIRAQYLNPQVASL